MWKFAPYVFKSLWRHRIRTALTASGTAVTLFVYCLVGSIQEGLGRLTADARNDSTLIVFQANRFCPSTSKLPEDYARQIAKLPGVRDAVPIKVFMNNCRASLDVVVFNGLPADKLLAVRDLRLTFGDWNQFTGRQDAAVVGQAIANRRKLAVGQRFSIGELTVTVLAIFESPTPADENFIYVHLPFLQRTKGLGSVGTVTQIEVLLAERADAKTVCHAIDDLFRSGPVATNTRPRGVFQASAVGDLADLIGATRYLGYACVGLAIALVGTTTVMGVQDRIREHAVLQTIGFTGRKVFAFVVAESGLVSFAGGAVGVAVATAVLGFSSLAVGAEGVMIPFRPSINLAATGLAIAATSGLLAGIIPAFQAARTEIVAALRAAG